METKLTDEEIVKALECCINECDCENCPYGNNDDCMANVEDILDLIYRLQSEKSLAKRDAEVHKTIVDGQIKIIDEQKAEIERLTEENEYLDMCGKQLLADYQKCEIERAELQKQVFTLTEERENMQAVIFCLEEEKMRLQKQVDEYFKKAYFYYQKCKAYGIEFFYDDEFEAKPAKEGETIVFPKFNGEEVE